MNKVTCPKCGNEKLPDEFARDASKRTGRKSHCKACDNLRSKRWYYSGDNSKRASARRAEYNRQRRAQYQGQQLDERSCATCAQPYIPHRKDQRYCSTACHRSRSRSGGKRRGCCARCGGQFLGGWNQRFCSKRCGAKRRELVGPVLRRMVNIVVMPSAPATEQRTWTMGYCAECNTPFVDSRMRTRYCGDRCAKRAARRIGKQARNKRIKDGVLRDRISHAKVAKRDGWRCHICKRIVSRKTWSLDHLVPLSDGGDHTYANVALAHHHCNTLRNNKGAAQLLLIA